MPRISSALPAYARGVAAAVLLIAVTTAACAQKPAATQPNDEEYTKRIHEYLQDPRITTELVDHLPASRTIPTPLKFLGTMPGQPGELYYSEDINRYFEALAKASPRAKFWKLPRKTEEGRDMVVLAIASEDTIKHLDQYKADLAALGDPRKTTEAQAQHLIHTSKPLYWLTSGIHSPETGGPQMLTELAYRLLVEDTPLIRNIREHTVVLITPVVEPDGRDKEVDTYYYGKKTGKPRPPLMYWGKYVAHDNNRDGMGQALALTQNLTEGILDWHPTVFHDLHEAQSYLYVSTGTGPYNPSLDPIASQEWWLLAETELMGMAKRNVPGVFTYGFYDGWVPNYLFWIAETHNSFGRFYEVQSYGPDVQEKLQLPATATSREWYRSNPPLPSIKWGPRNNTNIQESALLIALDKVATDRELYLDNYWEKAKRTIARGTEGPTYGWVIPAAQVRRSNAADMVNDLRHQGVEFNVATAATKLGSLSIAPGDYLIRADQPYRTLVDMYFSLQNYPASNPLPYDDTGWTMPLMRNVVVHPITDKSVLTAAMKPITEDVVLPGTINNLTTGGTGNTVIVDANADNVLVTFRFSNPTIAMQAAEEDFDAAGHHFHAGAFIVPDGAANPAIAASVKKLGLIAYAADKPAVKSHALTVPRIGYVHSWQRTQDEGWVRLALDRYGIPFTYFADQKLKEGHLRDKYDVIVFPTIGGTSISQVNGIAKTGSDPIPYKKSELTPNLGAEDSSDDIRGGMGIEGLAELVRFVREGGTLLTEGSTTTILPDYGILNSVRVEHPTTLYAKGSILRGIVADHKSPIAYGYTADDLPVYFSGDTILSAGAGGPGVGVGGLRNTTAVSGVGEDITPYSHPEKLSPFVVEGDPEKTNDTPDAAPATTQVSEAAAMASLMRQYGMATDEDPAPRVVIRFPDKPTDILLSGELAGGENLTHRALAIDASLGKGHVVMFALRPYWRWQTQGTYALGFNTLLNWDHLDAGAPPPSTPATGAGRGRPATPGNNNR